MPQTKCSKGWTDQSNDNLFLLPGVAAREKEVKSCSAQYRANISEMRRRCGLSEEVNCAENT